VHTGFRFVELSFNYPLVCIQSDYCVISVELLMGLKWSMTVEPLTSLLGFS